jgi:hypothetical protein
VREVLPTDGDPMMTTLRLSTEEEELIVAGGSGGSTGWFVATVTMKDAAWSSRSGRSVGQVL